MSQELVFEQVYGWSCLKETHLPWPCYRGKVRDIYDLGKELLLVSTDRLSAFDRAIALIPEKGNVLTQLSAWWFSQTQAIVANHMIDLPAPCVMRVKKCKPLPIEMVVRGYITGSTNTSLWTLYQQGQREFFGVHLPEGLQKNARLEQPMLTPTTKDKDHDRPLALEDIDKIPGLTEALWQEMCDKALKLFKYASYLLAAKGLVIADTKYEFGLDDEGQLLLIDEVHTSDSSRYWDMQDWQQAYEQGREPKSFDKELIRLWYRQHCNPYEDKILPVAPEDLIEEVSVRYRKLYQEISGQTLQEGSFTCAELLEYLAKRK